MSLAPLAPEQKRVVDHLITTGHHTFITGKAGTGKSHILKHFQNISKKKILVTAATGVAALNVDGKTLHRALGLGTSTPPDLYTDHAKIRYTHQWITDYNVLVIDEVSMVSSDMMDAIDRALREIREDEDPFGGMQIVMFGDPYQLPPVVTDIFRKYLQRSKYASEWFFDAHVWRRGTSFDTFSLEKIHRQGKDEVFKRILNGVRDATISDDDLNLLNYVGVKNQPSEESLLLGAYNNTVAARNARNLALLPGKAIVYDAKVNKGFGRDEPAEREITIKPGARVMLLTNDREERWVNGTTAKVLACDESWIQVELDNGDRPVINFHQWAPADTDPENYAQAPKYNQIPVKLAWGVTIHKSQGMSLPEIEIDLGRGAFSPGQTYVALSRATSINGLVLRNHINKADITVDQHVRKFFAERAITPA